MPRHPLIRPSGVLITRCLDSGKETFRDTVQCCHCGGHFVYEEGSRKRRGFCTRCAHTTCGRPGCDPCVPNEQWLENVEQGRPEGHRRIIVPGGFDAPAKAA